MSEQVVEVSAGLLPLLPHGRRHPSFDFGPDRRDACQRRRLSLSFQFAATVLPYCRSAAPPGDLFAFDQSCHGDSP